MDIEIDRDMDKEIDLDMGIDEVMQIKRNIRKLND
jgi:hypothetical protein